MADMDNHTLVHLLNQRARLLAKEVNIHLKDHRLYHSQWSVLFCLHQFGPMSQTDIWKYLNVEAPTITRTLVRMEKNGWIIRTPGEDKRERIIQLSDDAKNKFPFIKQTIHTLETEMLSDLTSEEKKQLHYLLSKIGNLGDKI